MNKVIAFSLWGDDPKYTIGAIRNAELAKEIFPDWICWFYCGEDVPEDIKKQLLDLDSEIIDMGGSGWNGMFWRFFAADQRKGSAMISRDTDSRLGLREGAAVDEWMQSDRDFHIMRDHPHHATEILGGMWGAKNGILEGIKGWIGDYDTGDFHQKYQVDQNFLRDVVYPMVKHKTLVHDEFFEKRPFPSNAPPRTNNYFVGQAYNHLDEPEFN